MRAALFFVCFVIGCSQPEQKKPPEATSSTSKKTTLVPLSQAVTTLATAPASAPTTKQAAAIDDEPAQVVSAGTKLAKLPGASLPLKTFVMSGPFASYDDFCKASLADLYQEGTSAGIEFDPKPSIKEVCPTKIYKEQKRKNDEMFDPEHNEIIYQDKPGETYQQIKIVHYQNLNGFSGRAAVELAVQVNDKWYGVQLVSYFPYMGDAGNASENLRTIKELSVTDAIPGGEKELVFILSSRDDYDGRADQSLKQKELLFICGINNKGKPACYPSIRVSDSEDSSGFYGSDDDAPAKPTIKKANKMKEPYLKDGQLTLEPEAGSEFPKRVQALFGVHTLAFQ